MQGHLNHYMVSIPSVGIIQIRFKRVETVTRLLSAGSDQLPFDNINLLSVVIMNWNYINFKTFFENIIFQRMYRCCSHITIPRDVLAWICQNPETCKRKRRKNLTKVSYHNDLYWKIRIKTIQLWIYIHFQVKKIGYPADCIVTCIVVY